jgi:hypothetical protein
MTFFRGKRFEFEIGLFGPELKYYTCYQNDDYKGRFVISLILIKLYIGIGSGENNTNKLSAFGFHSASDPDRIVWQWGDYYKALFMPWNRVVVKRSLVDIDDNVIEVPIDDVVTIDTAVAYMKRTPEKYVRHYKGFGYDADYYVTHIITCPALFKTLNLHWFDKQSFEVITHIKHDDKYTDVVTFNTNYNIALEAQIDLQLMIRNGHVTDF